MKWASTLTNSPSVEKSIKLGLAEIREKLGGETPDLAFLFVSPEYRDDLIDLWPVLRREINIKHLIGCTAGGVIGAGKEVEQEAAVSITAAVLPNVQITPFQFQQPGLPDGDKSPRVWRDLIGVSPEQNPSFFIFSDPFSIDSDALIAGLDYAFPNAVKVGGVASGGYETRENLLLLDEKIMSHGAVGMALSGEIKVEAVVAQGCRPIGKTLSITASDGNVLLALDNEPPLKYVQELYEKLTDRDKELLSSSLFLGIVMDPYRTEPKQGDFLIRNIIGVDQATGHLAIGAALRNGQTVQFHLRDANTSHDDLQQMLAKSPLENKASGAVLFSCMGRGQRLYGNANHDSDLLKSVIGDVPVGGFFCNGEIGPVGGKTYLHGYTSSIAVISPVETKK